MGKDKPNLSRHLQKIEVRNKVLQQLGLSEYYKTKLKHTFLENYDVQNFFLYSNLNDTFKRILNRILSMLLNPEYYQDIIDIGEYITFQNIKGKYDSFQILKTIGFLDTLRMFQKTPFNFNKLFEDMALKNMYFF